MRKVQPSQIFVWELKEGDRIAEWVNGTYYYGTVTSNAVLDQSTPSYYMADIEWDYNRHFNVLGQSMYAPQYGPVLYYESFEEA